MVPTPIYDNDTVPTPFVTMVELVFGCDDDEPVDEEALWNEGPLSYAEDR